MNLLATSLSIWLVFLLFPCEIESQCYSNQWRCTSGNCIQGSYLCDGGRDCSDNSDEENCSCRSGPQCYISIPTCTSNEFRCNSGACIPKLWECDGDYDCADLSDEHSTCERVQCSGLQFTCDNGFCIDGRLKCNGMNDCGDNSDEVMCKITSMNPTTNKSRDCGKDFQCKNGLCIDYDLVCDKEKHCLDGSDEDGLCLTACIDGPNLCDHGYRRTPSGCLCTCNKGYHLAGDGITCVDTLECTKDPPVCSQLCKEEEGAYSCGCFKEFRMRYDNVTCKSKGDPMSIYFTVRNEIRQYMPFRRTLKVIHIEESGDIAGLEVDVKTDTLYFTVKNMSSLHNINAQNASRKTISNVGDARNVAFDWISKNIYYITEETVDAEEDSDNSELTVNWIQVCNFNERHCAKLKKNYEEISALAVDPIHKYLFYALINGQQCNIFLCLLDGSSDQWISTCSNTSEIAIDYRNRHLYIANVTTIVRLDYDADKAGNRQMVNILNTGMHIQGLNIFENHLYFVSDGGRTMLKCKLFGDFRRCTSFSLSANSTGLFVVAQMSRQTPGLNHCVNYNCSHLCVPIDTGAHCVCENGNVVDENDDCRE